MTTRPMVDCPHCKGTGRVSLEDIISKRTDLDHSGWEEMGLKVRGNIISAPETDDEKQRFARARAALRGIESLHVFL